MGNNSTLNIINIEIAELKLKQSEGPLGIIEIKKLESLVKMRKDLSNTQEVDDYQEVDEDAFTEQDILEFLKFRKKNEKSRQDGNTIKKSTTKKKKTPKKTKKAVSKG